MSRKLHSLLIAIGFIVALGVPAHASPRCLKDQKPFALAEDTVTCVNVPIDPDFVVKSGAAKLTV